MELPSRWAAALGWLAAPILVQCSDADVRAGGPRLAERASTIEPGAALPNPLRGRARGASFLLVTLDTTRADRLGCYGHTDATTPHVDRLASEGVLVERVWTVAPVTLPSHASILSGQYPIEHGVHDNGLFTVPAATPLVAETLREAGYSTAAFVSAYVLDSAYGIAQGFDVYDDSMQADAGRGIGAVERLAEGTVDAALAWLGGRPARPWFVWLHLFDPHSPYAPPPPFDRAAHPYDGELAYSDHHLGRLLDALAAQELLDETLVVLTADHGDSLGEHGEPTHGMFVYDSTMAVPLILRHPALPAGMRLGGQVSVVDVVPTVLDLLGLEAEGRRDGRSFLPALASDAPAPWRVAYLENQLPRFSYGLPAVDAVCSQELKYIDAPQPELYDLRLDPAERSNLVGREPEAAASMRALLQAARADRDPLAHAPDRRPGAEELERLAALGYGQGDAVADEALAPWQFARVQERFGSASAAIQAGRLDEAERILRPLLAAHPGHTGARGLLGQVLVAQGRMDEGIALLERSLEQRPDDRVNARILAASYDHVGRFADALAMFEHILRYCPSDVEIALEASRRASELGDPARARRLVQPLTSAPLTEQERAEVERRLEELSRVPAAAGR